MDLDPHENADLTVFFSKRFPSPEERSHLASAARIAFREPNSDNPEAAWGGLITRAREQDALVRLAHCAARKRPADENLQGVAAILSGRQWPPVPAPKWSAGWKQVGALSTLLAVAGVAWAARAPRDASPTPMEDAHFEAAPDPSGAASTVPVDSEPTMPVGTAQDDGSADPSPETDAATETTPARSDAQPAGSAGVVPAKATPPAAPIGNGSSSPPAQGTASATAGKDGWTGNCRGKQGELIGYWYAGAVSPGQKGDVITVPRDLNVRADYPDAHNGYNRRAPIRCTLGVGKSLVLTGDPIAVPGDAYWVPLYATGPR